jgi:Uma2 family endonuclease
MVQAKVWTLEELHSLPDDGNKYELLHGELFVTPVPTLDHETIIARLTALLVPFVMANGLGYVYSGTSVITTGANELLPDLLVRQPAGCRASCCRGCWPMAVATAFGCSA